MELEVPGEEKKKRWEAKTEAKSGSVEEERSSSSEEEDGWVKVVELSVEGGG